MSAQNDLSPMVSELLNDFAEEDARKKKMDEWINNLPEDKLMEALKSLNPYGVTLPTNLKDEETCSISYTNMRLEFVKRLVTTSMIGFLMRMLREYNVPDEVQAVEPEDYLANPACAEPPSHIKDAAIRKKYEEYKASMPERVAIWRFLQSAFDFDPDKHVAAALQTNLKDPRRKTPDVQAARRAILAKKNSVREVKRLDYEISKVEELTPLPANTSQTKKDAFSMIPPLDLFAKYDRYLEEHYEEYMDCVNVLYGARPDIDFCLTIYDKHQTKEDAKLFKDRYMEQVIAPITNVRLNKWVALGPYRENREKVDFYNKHTEVLREMVEQRERDSHVATDIMKKKIKTKKAQNIAEAGPDDKEFRQYLKANKPEIARLGGEHVKQDGDDDDECPPDAVEVNVFTLGEGGRELKVHKIYNPIEAPIGEQKN